jgi:alkylhydroperoxidase family enzyme
MFGFLVRWGIRSAEKKTGEPLDYLRELYADSPGTFWQFTKVAKAAGYRNKLPAPAFHVARIVAVRIQDCGPCVQTCVNLAKADGVDPAVLKAALARDFATLRRRSCATCKTNSPRRTAKAPTARRRANSPHRRNSRTWRRRPNN